MMRNSGDNVFGRTAAAALERMPTYARVRRGIFRDLRRVVDVRELDAEERKQLLERLMKSADHDSEKLLDQIRRRFDAVGLGFPKVEVRFERLTVECFVQVGSRALPTVPNYICNIAEAVLRRVGISRRKRRKMRILGDISGIIRPSRSAFEFLRRIN